MIFSESFSIESDREALWDILMDVNQVADCLPGVEELEVLDEDHYRGLIAVAMGPVKLRFKGEINVTSRDKEAWNALLTASANDAKAGGGFRASLQMQLSEAITGNEPATDLSLKLETTFLGRIGELGRPLIKKKISTIMNEFVKSLNLKIIKME